MIEHLNAASNSHAEDILYVSQCEPRQSLVTCQVTNTCSQSKRTCTPLPLAKQRKTSGYKFGFSTALAVERL